LLNKKAKCRMGEVVARVQKHRAKLRNEGTHSVQRLVAATRIAGFAKECRQQSALLNNDQHEVGIMLFLNEVADRAGWKT
jgi:Protein  of unknown function (DUF3018)